ncbi:DUF3558 domain-containing protein [Kibdelosporangium persicum]|uniref:DUF3558 family protein n=1 Tax=Kibdelosporangium persicum TaxID=2698649 RepID=UPI001563C403|nr:DUF3558 family protein [Kibdelosporangium persicum]
MTVLTRRVQCVGASAALVVFAALAGCTQSEGGTPTPAAGGTSANDTPRPGPGTTTSRSTSSDTPIDACDLLSDANAKDFGLATPGTAKTAGGMPGCQWIASGQFVLLISIDKKGLTGVNGENVPLSKHKATKVADVGGVGGCGIGVETTDGRSTAIIGVTPTTGNAPEQACARAVEVAKVVDSTLP